MHKFECIQILSLKAQLNQLNQLKDKIIRYHKLFMYLKVIQLQHLSKYQIILFGVKQILTVYSQN